MTKHKIDDLFKQKLVGHESQPSPAAWSKLESQLNKDKKKGVVFWVGMAASIALLITFGWLMLSEESPLDQPTIAVSDPIVPEVIIDTVQSTKDMILPKEDVQNDHLKNEDKEVINHTPQASPSIKKSPVKKKKKKKTPVFLIQQESNFAQNTTDVDKEQAPKTEELNTADIADASLKNTELVASNTTPEEKGSVKLVYTLKPVIAHRSIEVSEEPEEEKKKASPFKKAFAFAKGIKENPAGIGSLREAKNDLLSLKKKNDSK